MKCFEVVKFSSHLPSVHLYPPTIKHGTNCHVTSFHNSYLKFIPQKSASLLLNAYMHICFLCGSRVHFYHSFVCHQYQGIFFTFIFPSKHLLKSWIFVVICTFQPCLSITERKVHFLISFKQRSLFSGFDQFSHFQGIDHLDFRPDKFGNQDIVGMVSAQVTFSVH